MMTRFSLFHQTHDTTSTFFQLPLLCDKHYKEQEELVDMIAERIQILGGVSLAMAPDVAETTSIPRAPKGREEVPVQISRLLHAHEIVLEEARAMARLAAKQDDQGTNDLLVSDVIRRNELQVWFVAAHVVDEPLAHPVPDGLLGHLATCVGACHRDRRMVRIPNRRLARRTPRRVCSARPYPCPSSAAKLRQVTPTGNPGGRVAQVGVSGTAAGLQTDVVVGEGNAAGGILEHAKSLPADLIVVGTHGQGGFERLVLGSVAEKVLRKAACPVMTVPPPAASTSKRPFKQLLCPVGCSDSSTGALRFALSLAQESNARITLLHVVEWPADEASARRVLETSEFHRQWEAETRHQLEALIPDDVRNWCAPEPTLACGKAYQQILSVAATTDADLIVMGVRGRFAIDMMLLGSTTQQVVRQAACPVLTLRS